MQTSLSLSIQAANGPCLGEGGFGNNLIANFVFGRRYSLVQRVIPLMRGDEESRPPVLNRFAKRERWGSERQASADAASKNLSRTYNWSNIVQKGRDIDLNFGDTAL
jgi:hypothetical protein